MNECEKKRHFLTHHFIQTLDKEVTKNEKPVLYRD